MDKKKSYGEQWTTRLSTNMSLYIHKLREYLFQIGTIGQNKKYPLIQYCMLNTLFEFADEVIPDFTYDPEDLVELIEKHEALVEKFRERLLLIAKERDKKKESEEVNGLKVIEREVEN